jgi:SAM-dependent methyltransferase
MQAEFDTVAEWTAEAALALGPEHHLAAGCRGSGSPAALDWLLRHLRVDERTTLLDSGAGVGGPAAYAARGRGARPVLVEPEVGACRASRRLFGLPVVRGDAARLPMANARFGAAWSLGVLCTMDEQVSLLRELVRVTAPPSRVGLLVYVARHHELPEQPAGNDFPTASQLIGLVAEAGLRVDAWASVSTLPPAPDRWRQRERDVDEELARRHGGDQAWEVAQEQSARIGRLLREEDLSAELLSLRAG